MDGGHSCSLLQTIQALAQSTTQKEVICRYQVNKLFGNTSWKGTKNVALLQAYQLQEN